MAVEILGVRVNTYSKEEALEKVSAFLDSDRQHIIFTPNPEMLVLAQQHLWFREILNRGDLNLCDGRGIQLVAREKIERLPGSDFMLDICALAEQKGKSIFLLGAGETGGPEAAASALQARFPRLKIAGWHQGPAIGYQLSAISLLNEEENAEVIRMINASHPSVLLVAFGSPKQEWWIDSYLLQIPSVRVSMGVGGAFDFLSGRAKRASPFIRSLGLEWLWRLLHEPRRIVRIWNATAKFLWLVYKNQRESCLKRGREKERESGRKKI